MAKKQIIGPSKDEERSRSLERFLASRLAETAGKNLSDRACIALHIEDDAFFFQRENGKNTLLRVGDTTPDLHFWLPMSTLRHLTTLAELPHTGLGTLGVAILEHLFTNDKSVKIRFRFDTGFLGLWSKGYFSILKAGGPEVAFYLGRAGFGSLSRIKAVMKQIRG